ncbi:MAG: sulfurtransferase TusA family protein [Thermoleophilaceae bacterium]
MSPGEVRPASFADVEEMGCGSLMVALMRAMREVGRGELLQVRAADPGARHDIPSWCRMTGHRLLDGPYGATEDEYLIRKRED